MNALAPVKAGEIIEAVIARGDIAQLTPDERAKYYVRVCESVGLNPMTRPFEYITLNGKLTLYARKDATDQLRSIHNVSVTDLAESEREGVFVVTAKVMNGKGRTDMAKGAVNINGLKGEALANALMKAETKAKRRATLSVCGLGFLDEIEIEDIPAEAKGTNGKHTTLPKKDARHIYEKLQAEVRSSQTRDGLKAWMEANKERIVTLPEDWQDILRLQCQEMLVDLQQREAKPADEMPDLPESLKREAPKPSAPEINERDPEAFLRWADGLLGTVTDAENLETVWNDQVAPRVEQLFPPDQEEAIGIYRKHERRLEP